MISGVRFALGVGTWVSRVDLTVSPLACHVLVGASFHPEGTANSAACYSLSYERHKEDVRPCFWFIVIIDGYQK